LLRRLARSGGYRVVGISRRVPAAGFGGLDVEWVSVDLTDESCVPTLHRALEGVDAVVHLAWGFQPSHDQAYLEELALAGTRRVVDAVTSQGVAHLVHMSSIGAYSPKADDEPVDDRLPSSRRKFTSRSRRKFP
jgi:nucleoside-diphosphate-sugar epimerase